jgi:deazaflavin-dependent oxidoreductase (nitroreductase family)
VSSVEERLGGEQYCYLTTTGRRTGKPREIEIWFAAVGDTIYLMNGGTGKPPGQSDWVLNARANPSVRVRIGDEAFSGEARVVPFDSAEHEHARDLLVAKYATPENGLSNWRATAVPVAIALRPANRIPNPES